MQRLQQQYGFSCSCPRCTDEGRLDGAFQSLLQDMYEASAEQLQVDLQAAVERGDEASVGSIRDQLATYVQVGASQCHRAGSSSMAYVHLCVHRPLQRRGDRLVTA
jgi:hypothetical protein